MLVNDGRHDEKTPSKDDRCRERRLAEPTLADGSCRRPVLDLLVLLARSMRLMLFCRSFDGMARVVRTGFLWAGLGQGFVDQAGYFNALLDALVDNETDRRGIARLQS